MYEVSKRSTVAGLRRAICDEWAMLALLAAGIVQTGIAVSAMNGMVRSHQQITPTPYAETASAPAPTASPNRESVAYASPAHPTGS